MDFILQYGLNFVLGIVTTWLVTEYKNLNKKQKAVNNGVKALLRDRIIQTCNHYRDKGYCPVYALDNVNSLYKEYHALGGNGTITTLVEEMHHLPREERSK